MRRRFYPLYVLLDLAVLAAVASPAFAQPAVAAYNNQGKSPLATIVVFALAVASPIVAWKKCFRWVLRQMTAAPKPESQAGDGQASDEQAGGENAEGQASDEQAGGEAAEENGGDQTEAPPESDESRARRRLLIRNNLMAGLVLCYCGGIMLIWFFDRTV